MLKNKQTNKNKKKSQEEVFAKKAASEWAFAKKKSFPLYSRDKLHNLISIFLTEYRGPELKNYICVRFFIYL